ncbi:MAG TPA: nucleoside recognition domain-containing protein [Verrucomicrobiae bacterium]|nr:nucleoside recognition domain-containing protein [Verrucomicrobiae bacterium]
MMGNWTSVVGGMAGDLFWLLLKIFFIIIPLFVLLEYAQRRGILDWLGKKLERFFAVLHFKKTSIFPLIAGLCFGISYGAGVLLDEARQGRLEGKQTFLVAAYLGICHAVFEDTLLFVAVGASGLLLVIPRLIAASLVVYLLGFLPERFYGKVRG